MDRWGKKHMDLLATRGRCNDNNHVIPFQAVLNNINVALQGKDVDPAAFSCGKGPTGCINIQYKNIKAAKGEERGTDSSDVKTSSS